jgi:endoglucanase
MTMARRHPGSPFGSLASDLVTRSPRLFFQRRMNQRDFIGSSGAAAAGLLLSSRTTAAAVAAASGSRGQPHIPRWRGFNLPVLGGAQRGVALRESDFEWMAEWGFNFARLPLSYWAWTNRKDWMSIDERALAPVDQAIEYGRQHGVHINLCLHRIPGYCVNGRELCLGGSGA